MKGGMGAKKGVGRRTNKIIEEILIKTKRCKKRSL